ncbi:unnamed protein product [Polarella glacialis]|uniref:Protein kinase domain-containing protein n=1 Tax=Polarella glacialis TaxID=89957 RepID=A0A813FYR9_POLGL|nr:unnamed protein product [Polarella glacialis]
MALACWKGVCSCLRPQSSFQDYYTAAGDKQLGEGSFSTVFVATCKSTGLQRAVKKILRSGLTARISADIQNGIDNEFRLTMASDHPNINKLSQRFEDQRYIYLVMELCSGGELCEGIVEADCFTEHQAAILMRQVCSTLSYMHGRGVCHRDIKPEHYLFVRKGPLDSTPLKLIDFGLSCCFQPGEVLREPVGTALYVAPEVLKEAYGSACDLWSFGVIVYLILGGSHPFNGDSAKQVAKSVRKGRFSLDDSCWQVISDDAKDLIHRLLEKDAQTRITAAQAQDHVWLRPGASNSNCADLGPEVIGRLRTFCAESRHARTLCAKEPAGGDE